MTCDTSFFFIVVKEYTYPCHSVSLKIVLVFKFSCLSDWGEIPSNKLTGLPGKIVTIACNYPVTHSNNTKFLCKGQNPFRCDILIETTEKDRDVTNNRFKIRDNVRKNYFYVYISNLSSADSGTYWCGSDGAWQQAEFNKTLLTVGKYKHIIFAK